MYKILKNLGIKNNKFFLAIYDKSLIGVDPFDEKNLTKEQKIRIRIEVQKNPWYFLREIVRIPVAGGLKRYEIHRGNLALDFCMLNNINSITILPRQNYKTVSANCNYSWIYDFGTENSYILYLHKEFGDSKRNLKVLKDIRETLPIYLQTKHKNDKNNIEIINSAVTNNTIQALASARDEPGADKAGRGLTSPLQFWDEAAFLKYNNIIYGASIPAASQGILEAKNNGKPYGITMLTTPNNIDLPESVWFKGTMIENACLFTEDFYDWTKEEIEEYIHLKSVNDFVYIEFSYKQIGRSEKWFQNQCRMLNNNLLLIKREILLEWTKASDVSVYTEEQLENIEQYMKTPTTSFTIDKFWKLYILDNTFDFRKRYLISVDPTTGSAQDASAITIIDPSTFMPIAEFRENKIDTLQLEKVITTLMTRYFPNAVLTIENNSIGKAILDHLKNNKLIVNRIYYEYREQLATDIQYDMRDVKYSKRKQQIIRYGVTTDSVSRNLMLDILTDHVDNLPQSLATPFIYADIKGLERNKKGKIEHGIGQHDDSLFSYLIGIYTLIYGKNLHKFLLHKVARESTDMTNSSRHKNITSMNNFLEKARNIDLNAITAEFSDLTKKLIAEEKENEPAKQKQSFFNSILNLNTDENFNDDILNK